MPLSAAVSATRSTLVEKGMRCTVTRMAAGHRIRVHRVALAIAAAAGAAAAPAPGSIDHGTQVAASRPVHVMAREIARVTPRASQRRILPLRRGRPSRLPNPAAASLRATAAEPLAPRSAFGSPVNFEGPDLFDSGAFPPDTQGAVGPAQFVVAINGRFRSYSKATGLADGAINADPDAFFSPVMSPAPPGGVVFTSDPHIRYDRLSQRW